MRRFNALPLILSAGCGLAAGVVTLSAAYRKREPAYQPPRQERLPEGAANSIAIAPRSEALTFARFRNGDVTALMLVESYTDGVLQGTLVHEEGNDAIMDPIALFKNLGYARIEGLTGASIDAREEDLVVPFDGTSCQIAIGGNHPKHAAETAIAKNFLFPKLNAPGAFLEPIPAGEGLLDHEVELGFVALEPIRNNSVIQHMGLVLASDYTDRAVLLRRVDPRNVTSGKGFTEAKSKAGYMPVGNLFVIPKDLRTFYRTLRMTLYVDGQLHQDARPEEMVWDIDRMRQQSFQDEGRQWECGGRRVSLPVREGVLVARTMILSGTSDGVIFRKPSGRQLALGMLEVALGGFRNVQAVLIEPTVREAQEQRRYLQPGMQVVMRADKLGIIRNPII